MYRLGKHRRSKRRRVIFWLLLLILLMIVVLIAIVIIRGKLQPHPVITNAAPRVSKVTYENKTKHYEEPDFSIDLPAAWQPVSRVAGNPYQTYAWQVSTAGTKGQEFKIYEDTIPSNFAVNRLVVIEGQVDHLQLGGSVSDNCATFTKGLTPVAGQMGVPAKWQDTSFLCDQANQQRDVLGTSSSDGVNTVLLKNQSTGLTHKFFFTFTNQSTNPDYSPFYAALQSLRMR